MNVKYQYPIIINCIYCKRDFEVNRASDLRKKSCSNSCRISLNNKSRIWKQSSKDKLSERCKAEYQGSSNPNYKGGGINCKCLECGNNFKIPSHNQNNKKHGGIFCSKTCCYDHWRKNKVSTTQRNLSKIFGRNISRLVKSYKEETSNKWLKILGYSLSELKIHLESQFVEGMSWDNYGKGGWHIDHKKPMSYFKFESEIDDDFKTCWSLSNLQPLWEKDNLSKGGSNTKINIKIYGTK